MLPKNRVFIDACVFVLSLISRCASRTKEITNDLRTQYFFLSLRFFQLLLQRAYEKWLRPGRVRIFLNVNI